MKFIANIASSKFSEFRKGKRTMAEKMNIFEAINKTMEDVGAIGKTSKNQQQGFMFRGIDAVMNALNPAMIKNGIFVVPQVLEQTREERQTSKGGTLIYSVCRIKYTFYAQDGSSVEAVVVGEGMDSGDKATNKAMSIAFKYACFQVFCIPTEEMKDPDEECHEVRPKKTPTEADMKKVENVTLSEAKVNSIKKKAEADGVSILTILDKCSKSRLEDLTEKQYAWVCANWSKEFVNGK